MFYPVLIGEMGFVMLIYGISQHYLEDIQAVVVSPPNTLRYLYILAGEKAFS